MTASRRLLVTAKFVMPLPGRLLERHFVVIEDDRITAVEKFRAVDSTSNRAEVIDLGDAVIMPGFVNAHTHLDLGHLKPRVNFDGRFVPWLQSILTARATSTPAEIHAGIRRGLKTAAAGGTTTIGDVTYSDQSAELIRESGLRGVVFFELIGLEHAHAEAEFLRVTQRLDHAWQRDLAWRPNGELAGPALEFGLAPLAPYAVSSPLYAQALELMVQRGDRLITHVAETEAERELLQVYSGDFVPWVERMSSEDSAPLRAAASPVSYLADLTTAAMGHGKSPSRALRLPTLVHANYVDRDDIEMLSDLNAQVVFCPRHHLNFDHGLYPLDELLGHAVTVALGTESLLSTDSLSILDEVRFVANGPHGGIGPVELLKLATLNGARALGLEDEVGVLAPGMQADLIAIPVSPSTTADRVANEIVYGEAPVSLSVVAGRVVYQWLTGGW